MSALVISLLFFIPESSCQFLPCQPPSPPPQRPGQVWGEAFPWLLCLFASVLFSLRGMSGSVHGVGVLVGLARALAGVDGDTGHNVVHAKEGAGRLDRSLQHLLLDGQGLKDAELLHVNKHPLIAVNTNNAVLASVRRPQLRQAPDNGATAVLHEGAGDHLEGLGHGKVGALLGALDGLALGRELLGDCHFDGAAAADDLGVGEDVARHAHGVLEVTLDLVEGVLGGTTQQDGAGLALGAVEDEGEVLVTDLLDLEQPGPLPDVRLIDLLHAVHNRRPGGAGDTVVVSLPETADARDPSLDEVVLREVRHTLLGDDNVRLVADDALAGLPDPLLLHVQELLPVGLVHDLDVEHRLRLLVLKGAVEQQDAGVRDLALHTLVGHVLVEHHTGQHLAVLHVPAGNLLHLGVTLGVDFDPPADGVSPHHPTHRVDRELGRELTVPPGELGCEARVHDGEELLVVLEVHRDSHTVHDIDGVVQGGDETAHDLDRVQALHVQERLRAGEQLPGQDDNAGRTVTALLVLRPRELDHVLRRRVNHVDLPQNGVPVVGDLRSTHRVQDHLEHTARTQGGPHEVRHRLSRIDVVELRLPAVLTLGVRLQNKHLLVHF
eukprot:Hpha_TRINITY_DN15065_c5_g5::TRINITY_DN15065_c5_g5_i2::g.125118::m.125118